MKRFFALLTVLCLLPLSPVFARGAAAGDARTANVYLGSLSSPMELNVWHADGWDDVPFVSAEEYLDLSFYLADVYDYNVFSRAGGELLTIVCGEGRAVIDAGKNTVTLSDPEEFMPCLSLVYTGYGSVVGYSELYESTYQSGRDVTVRFDDYGLEIIASDAGPLVPFQAMEIIFGINLSGYAFVWNGQDFYEVSCLDDTVAYAYGASEPSPYQDALYSGPFAGKTALSPAYSRYYYGTAAMMMDLLHGRAEETGYVSMADYLSMMGLDRYFSSADPDDLISGVDYLLTLCFDTAHDGYVGDFGVFGALPALEEIRALREASTAAKAEKLRSGAYSPAAENDEWEDERYPLSLLSDGDVDRLADWYMGGGWEEDYGPAGQEMLRWTCLMEALCPKERTGNSLEMCGDTAVISFDTFTDDGSSDYYYLSLPGAEEWESDTFGFLYQCFDILSAVPEVRRVVIDLSNNGGGDVTALAAALGFLSKDGEVTLTYRNTFTGSYNDDRFHVDTNLDGVADSRDGWGDRYEFYIVTSGSTYSCGHAMAFFAAKQGLARVVGRQGGGGDCTVGLWYDAAGILASYSGCIQLGVMERGRFVSSEGNVPMAAEWGGGKYALDAPWYSPEGIVDFLDRLEAGDEAA